MKPIVKIITIVGVMLALFILNATVAKAQSIQDCASQENCIALLAEDQIFVYRKGVLKGTIGSVGSGDGTINGTNGWISAGRNGPIVYLYNVETGFQCNAYVEFPCNQGVVWLHPTDPTQDYAFFACPMHDSWVRVPVDCSGYIHVSTSGRSITSITMDEERIYMLSDVEGTIASYSPLTQSGNLALTFQTGTKQIRYWNNDVDPMRLFMGVGNSIMYKEVPVMDGIPFPFYTLPSGTPEYMAVSDTHVISSQNGSNDAYLIEIANPTSHTLLSATDSREVALSNEEAYVIEVGMQVGVAVFDMAGNRLYTINQPAYDITYIKPTLPPVCSNNLVEPGETCDGTDFDGVTCADYNFDGGALSCSVSCDTIFTSGCWSCGDGTMNPGEACDGTDLGTASCAAAGYDNGEVTCRPDCTVDYGQCYTCGNGLIEGAEACEGADLNGATCETAGFFAGTLACGTDCMLDTSACHMCGDSVANNGELCDGEDTPGVICQTMNLGYTGGQLLCDSVCGDYDDSQCYTCGDGVVNTTEECDGANLNEQDCSSLGLGSGTLSCFENCTFNLNACSDVPAEYCGNGTTDPGEECDDGNRSNSDDCSETCRIIPPTCGFGGVDPGETCDGTDLGGATCQTLGYEAGVLYCGGDCQLRTDDCHFISTPQTISLTLDAEPEPGELDEALATQYAALKTTLTPNCVSQNVNGDLVMTTTPGSYCSVRARVLDSPTGEKMFSFIFVPENPLENENPVLRFYQNGDIAQNFGGQITAFQGLQVKTVLAGDSIRQITQNRISSMGMKFLGVHPETQSRGRWLALNIGVGSTKFCTDEAGTNCATMVPQLGQIVINLDDLEKLSDLGWTPPKDGGGCSCQTGSNNSKSSLPVFFLLAMAFLFWNRRNRTK